jgi:hypothetical protein
MVFEDRGYQSLSDVGAYFKAHVDGIRGKCEGGSVDEKM